MTHTVTIHNENFILHPSGAIFWSARNSLLIADVHLGKVSHFRKAGVAVPPTSVFGNFAQLEQVTEFFNPGRIIFLGDLFHSDLNSEWLLFREWAVGVASAVILIAGNHDVIAPYRYEEMGVPVFDELRLGRFLLTHKPEEEAGMFNFCGHIHPSVRLRGGGRQFLTMPCFFHRPVQMILPAFGQFTGTYEMIPHTDDCVYAVTRDEVIVVCG